MSQPPPFTLERSLEALVQGNPPASPLHLVRLGESPEGLVLREEDGPEFSVHLHRITRCSRTQPTLTSDVEKWLAQILRGTAPESPLRLVHPSDRDKLMILESHDGSRFALSLHPTEETPSPHEVPPFSPIRLLNASLAPLTLQEAFRLSLEEIQAQEARLQDYWTDEVPDSHPDRVQAHHNAAVLMTARALRAGSPDVKTPETHPGHHTVGRRFRSFGEEYFCSAYDRRMGYWMTLEKDPTQEKNVSERAIGRTFHEIYS